MMMLTVMVKSEPTILGILQGVKRCDECGVKRERRRRKEIDSGRFYRDWEDWEGQ